MQGILTGMGKMNYLAATFQMDGQQHSNGMVVILLRTGQIMAVTGARQKAVSALAFAMGQPTVTPNDVADELEVKPYVVAPEEALSLAMENRPDLKGMDARIEASRTSLALAGKGLSPSLAGGLLRSEERRVGKECRSRWSPYH